VRAGESLSVGARLAVVVETFGRAGMVVRIEGEIDMATTPELVDSLLRAAESGARRLVVDLSDVSFMGAAGIHALEEVQAAMRHRGGELAVVAPTGLPRRVLELTGTMEPLGAVDTIDAARRRFD
jgi:anti-sigma B factor antagonist